MTVGTLDDAARETYGIGKDVSGVVITEVAEGSSAAAKGIAVGEVIAEIAQESVSSPSELLDRIKALKEQGRRNVLLMIASKSGELRFETLRVE